MDFRDNEQQARWRSEVHTFLKPMFPTELWTAGRFEEADASHAREALER